jgi:methionyl-tRNA formyltransferase
MQNQRLRIVFMGTPDFATASLKKLVEAGQHVVAVITAPDKPTGRGQQMSESSVKKYALSQQIPLLQPEKLKHEGFIKSLEALKADVFVVVAFRMLPEVVWAMPALGTFNLHGSLLPNYRGAAPIHWAVINGETETGVTTFFIQKEIDTGNIIFSDKISIGPNEDTGSVHDRLMALGADLVLKTIHAIATGKAPNTKQPENTPTKNAPKIFKETAQINWQLPAQKIHNFIRGMSPFPTAWTLLNGHTLKIFKSTLLDQQPTYHAHLGNYYTDGKSFLYFKSADGYLQIDELQLEGKKRLKTEEFLRGYRFN